MLHHSNVGTQLDASLPCQIVLQSACLYLEAIFLDDGFGLAAGLPIPRMNEPI